MWSEYQCQSQIYLARVSFVIKTQSEARLESKVLIVHVVAEVVCLRVGLETCSSCGNPFQIRGPATEKRRRPNEVSVRGTV